MNTRMSEADTLHPLERRVLASIDDTHPFDIEGCARILVDAPRQAHQVLSWLHEKEYTEIDSRTDTVRYEITARGIEYLQNGLPEERILALLRQHNEQPIPEIAAALQMEQHEAGSAIGKLIRDRVITLTPEKKARYQGGATPEFIQISKRLLEQARQKPLVESDLSPAEQNIVHAVAKKRGASSALFRVIEKVHYAYRWTDKGRAIRQIIEAEGDAAETISTLTPDMLKNGDWKGKSFRKFNIAIPPSRVLLGRTSAYSQFLRDVKDKLVALGFCEFDGPLVESEFWNCDALFMPQFHSARDTHDVYYSKSPTHAKDIETRYLDAVAETHESGGASGSAGWKYQFDRTFTKRLILRSQGTALSAKQLRNARVPGKYFGIVRCFRYDQIDSTHLSDFYQTEGIVLGDDVNLRTLLGLLRTLAVEIGATEEIKFVPGYFPFTEPSIEIFVKHPQLGWFELGGAGVFRPEVTTPFGINVPVLAWGIGIDRMALVKLRLNDLRQLFTYDIEKARLQTE